MKYRVFKFGRSTLGKIVNSAEKTHGMPMMVYVHVRLRLCNIKPTIGDLELFTIIVLIYTDFFKTLIEP
jgi:hypothetical protein